MNHNSISPLIMQNRLLSQARSGARARNTATGAVLNNSSGSKNSNTVKSQTDAKKTSSQQEAYKESKENYTAMKKAAESIKERTGKLLTAFDKNREELTEEDAVKFRKEIEEEISGYTDDYNTLIKMLTNEGGNANETYLQQLKDYFQSSKDALAEAGITQASNGILTLDENLLKEADLQTLEKIFGKENSFAGRVKERAVNIISNAEMNLSVINSSLYSGNYTYNKYGSDIYDILNGSSYSASS